MPQVLPPLRLRRAGPRLGSVQCQAWRADFQHKHAAVGVGVPLDDTGRASSSADITESLASPSSRSQRQRPALANQRIQTLAFKMKLVHLVKREKKEGDNTDRHPVTGNIHIGKLNNTCTVQAQDSRPHTQTHTHTPPITKLQARASARETTNIWGFSLAELLYVQTQFETKTARISK